MESMSPGASVEFYENPLVQVKDTAEYDKYKYLQKEMKSILNSSEDFKNQYEVYDNLLKEFSKTQNESYLEKANKIEEKLYDKYPKLMDRYQDMEFEYMLEALNKDLTKKGIADKTLIVICGDHVPYNDMEIVDELAGTTLDSFDRYRNTLIIYSASMDRPVRVDKPCSSLDILPTVLNLMGLEFDSRMLVGRDIFSDEQALVIMQDGSFITDKYRYNALTGEISNNGDYNVSDVELSSKLSIVSNRFRMADAICDLDYYSYIVRLKKEK
jgi:arylsulfatase A-like enzyme